MSGLKKVLNTHVSAVVTLICWGAAVVIAAGIALGEIIAAGIIQ